MQSMKNKLSVISLFILLIITSLSPIYIREYNLSKKLNVINVADSTLQDTSFNDSEGSTQGINEKLAIINSVSFKEEGVIAEKEFTDIPNEISNNIIDMVVNQLKLMGDKNAIPEIPEIDSQQFEIGKLSKKTFAKSDISGTRVNIWFVVIRCPQFIVSVYMDVETNKIYDLYFSLIHTEIFSQFKIREVQFKDFCTYLGISEEMIEYSYTNRYGTEYYILNMNDDYVAYKVIKDIYNLEYSLVDYDIFK